MEPMPGISSPAVRHYEQCNIAPKQEEPNGRGNLQDASGRDSNRRDGVHATGGQVPSQTDGARGLRDGGLDAHGSGIKLYGVTDKNMIAAGWSGGTLAIQFRYGLYHYANVAENVFVTLRKVPFPNGYFTKVVKAHPELYPCTKVG
jgi:hypothetical protein